MIAQLKTMMVFIFLVLSLGLNAHAQQGLSALAAKPKVVTPAEQSAAIDAEVQMIKKEFDASNDANKPDMQKALDEEVLPNSHYFMTGGLTNDLGSSAVVDDHAEVQVERELLWRYLRFNSDIVSREEGQQAAPKACLQVRAENGCAGCEALAFTFMQEANQRFTKRGFQVRTGPALATALNIQNSISGERAFEEYLSRILSEKIDDEAAAGCDLAFYSEVATRGTGKENQKRFDVTSFIEFKGLDRKKVRAKAVSSLSPEMRSSTKSTPQLSKMLANHQTIALFGVKRDDLAIATTLASKTKSSGVAAPSSTSFFKGESFIELRGVDGFLRVQVFKQAFSEAFPQVTLEDRMMKPTIYRFAVRSDAPMDVLVSKMTKAPSFKGVHFDVVKSGSDEAVLLLK